jgi:hypothetical protein
MIGICYSLLIHCVAERPGRAHMLRASKRIAPLWLQCLHGSASLRHPRSILKPWPPEMSLNAVSVFRRLVASAVDVQLQGCWRAQVSSSAFARRFSSNFMLAQQANSASVEQYNVLWDAAGHEAISSFIRARFSWRFACPAGLSSQPSCSAVRAR